MFLSVKFPALRLPILVTSTLYELEMKKYISYTLNDLYLQYIS